jgi:hypothetical protein
MGDEVSPHSPVFDTHAQGIDHAGEDKERVFLDRSTLVTGTGPLHVGDETRT